MKMNTLTASPSLVMSKGDRAESLFGAEHSTFTQMRPDGRDG
jgi:hypothetical protein